MAVPESEIVCETIVGAIDGVDTRESDIRLEAEVEAEAEIVSNKVTLGEPDAVADIDLTVERVADTVSVAAIERVGDVLLQNEVDINDDGEMTDEEEGLLVTVTEGVSEEAVETLRDGADEGESRTVRLGDLE